MPNSPAFRHDPLKAVILGREHPAVDWAREPVVRGYRMLAYRNKTLDRDIPVPMSATPVVIDGVGVIAASDDGYVRFYNRDLSKVHWERRVDSSVYASLVADTLRHRVIVAATSGLVACFDLKGRLIWSVRIGIPLFATPTILPDAGLLVVAGFHSQCIGVSIDKGSIVFERVLPEPWHAKQGGAASYRDPYASPTVTEMGTLVIACAEHVLSLAPDGTVLWQHEIGHSVRSSPAAVHDTGEIAACAVDGSCVFLDSATGASQAVIELGSKITASPALSGEVLAVGTQDDITTGLDVRSHQVVWQSTQGAPRSYTSFSVLPSGDFIASSGRGNVLCLGREDGAFRWETSQVLGLPDHETTVDITPIAGPAGDLYCASYSGVFYSYTFPQADVEAKTCPETQRLPQSARL